MKNKLIILLFLYVTIFTFKINTNAAEKFYLGDHVPDIYIYMKRDDKEVYRKFRMIYNSSTNNLVYCVEPGAVLSNEYYDPIYNYSSIFNFSSYKWEKIKKIAYYGYKYNNHHDIKWYAITQYMIWKELIPDNWELYFVDENHNKLDNLFQNEINEINNLVKLHEDKPYLLISYTFNLNDDKKIIDTNNLINKYTTNKGTISNNIIDFNNSLDIGDNKINLKYKNYKTPIYYYNPNGQNLLDSGDPFAGNLFFNVHVTSGNITINECDEESGEKVFIGGTYEVLDEDNEVINEIKCESEKECITDSLPIGNLSIRVKELNDNYNINEHIYDVLVEDGKTKEINICSLKKKQILSLAKVEKITNNNINNSNDNNKEINIPLTYKDSYFNLFLLLSIIILGLVNYKYAKNYK